MLEVAFEKQENTTESRKMHGNQGNGPWEVEICWKSMKNPRWWFQFLFIVTPTIPYLIFVKWVETTNDMDKA